MKVILLIMIGLSLLQADFIRDDAKEVVIDTTTDLMWQDDSDTNTTTHNWNDAIDYCEALTLGGYSHWRLPNKNELYLLADRSKHEPALSSVFQNLSSSLYWSSTTFAQNTSNAWDVDFHDGYGNAHSKTTTNYVRCVLNITQELK